MTLATKESPALGGNQGTGQSKGRSRQTDTPGTPVYQTFNADLLSRLREGILQYAERSGLEFRKAGIRWVTRCPFHEDRSPSFAIFQGQKGWRAICSPCGWSGDVFEFAKKLGRANDFREAVEDVASALSIPLAFESGAPRTFTARPLPEPKRFEPEAPPLPDDFEERHRASRARLWSSPELLEKAGKELGVPPEVIREPPRVRSIPEAAPELSSASPPRRPRRKPASADRRRRSGWRWLQRDESSEPGGAR